MVDPLYLVVMFNWYVVHSFHSDVYHIHVAEGSGSWIRGVRPHLGNLHDRHDARCHLALFNSRPKHHYFWYSSGECLPSTLIQAAILRNLLRLHPQGTVLETGTEGQMWVGAKLGACIWNEELPPSFECM